VSIPRFPLHSSVWIAVPYMNIYSRRLQKEKVKSCRVRGVPSKVTGSRVWLEAYQVVNAPNPYAHVTTRQSTSLRHCRFDTSMDSGVHAETT
jgi:hypothetical protein